MYCRSAMLYSWLLVRVITDAWYFLLKAVWLYQLKCWSGDFSLGEGSRDQQYCRGICVISLLTCVSLYTTYTQPFPFRLLERPRKLHIGIADPIQERAGAKLWCEAILLFYDIEGSVLGNILYDLWWLLSDLLQSNTPVCRTTSIRQQPTKPCQSPALSAFRGQNNYFRSSGTGANIKIHLECASKVCILTSHDCLLIFSLLA